MTLALPANEPRTERLWTAADGTFCQLSTCKNPPNYTVSLRRGEEVIRERRLYGLASAQVLAEGWREVGIRSDARWSGLYRRPSADDE